MKSFFKYIDIFGTRFHFLTYKKQKFKTFIGGIITIITFILTFIIIFLLEEDFYGFAINSTDLIYPMIYYYSGTSNSKGEYLTEVKEEYISYRKCRDSDFNGNQNLLKVYGDLYCIDWEDKIFGGYWDNYFNYHFAIRLFYCENGDNYSINNPKCSSLNELNNYFSNNSIVFSIYYTSIDFRVNDIKTPFHRKFKNYFCDLDHKFRKTDNIYLKEQILNDNQGWLFNNYKNISIWGGDIITSDYTYYSFDRIKREGFSSMFYSLNIFMSSDKIYHTRKYMKIQEIFSMIGGLLTFFHFIGKNINISINLSMKKSKIVEKFFKFSNKENTKFNFNLINNKIVQSNIKIKYIFIIKLKLGNKSFNIFYFN